MENETSSSEPWLRRRVAELEAENRRLQERLRLEQAARANATRDAVAAYQMQTMLQTELAHAQLDSGELEEYAEELMLVSQSLAEAVRAPCPIQWQLSPPSLSNGLHCTAGAAM